MDQPYNSEHLTADHDTTRLRSGHSTLDRWLRDSALHAEAKQTSRTYVWQHDNSVVAYYTFSAHLIAREMLPRVFGRGDPDQVPSVLLGRLALDRSLHGRGLGGELLIEALRRTILIAAQLGTRYVVVQAIDTAATSFYQHHGFRYGPDTTLLVRKVSSVARDLTPSGVIVDSS